MFKNNILSITVINNTTSVKPWVLFGSNQGSYNLPGIIVSVSESSLEQVNTESTQIPYKVESIKIKTISSVQLNMPIGIQTSDATGQFLEYKINPIDYLEPDSTIINSIKINNPNIIISGSVSFQGAINAGETMNIIIKIKSNTSFSNFLSNAIKKIKNKTWSIHWRLIPE